jgi:hypothetical protein
MHFAGQKHLLNNNCQVDSILRLNTPEVRLILEHSGHYRARLPLDAREIEDAVSDFQIYLYINNDCPKDIKGNDEDNIVNRLSKNGLQIEQSEKVRTIVDEENYPLRLKIANAVANVIGPKLTV